MCRSSVWRRSCGWIAACLLCSLCVLPLSGSGAETASQPSEIFRDGDTIVFFGDSITQGGHYIDHFEAWLLCRYPESRFQVFNRGISSETISGASETDHDPRRPWSHERFARDITPLKPQVLIACFGMNDGNYHPFDWPRFEQYQRGIRRLMQRARGEAGVRTLILMTPPPFDPYQRKPLDPAAKEFGYKFPAVNYDQTLQKYSEWLLSLRGEGQIVIDLHGTLNRHMEERRREEVSFTVIPDSIHPNMTGHWLMALELIRQLGLDVERRGFVRLEPGNDQILKGDRLDVSGLPLDPAVDPQSVQLESARSASFPWRTRLDWQNVFGKSSPSDGEKGWEITIDGRSAGTFTRAELRGEWSLLSAADPEAPRNRPALLARIRERRQLEYWQFRAGTDKPLGGKSPADDIPAKLRELTAEIEELRRPVLSTIELKQVR